MALPPGFQEVSASPTPVPSGASKAPPAGFTESSAGPDWEGIVKMALNEAKMGDGSKMKALMTDPLTQAKVLPYLSGTALALTGVPGGATAGTGGGHLLADAALKSYGREDLIPPVGKQILDTGLAAAGDVTAIPALNRKIFGSQIGSAERAAGVPPPQDIKSLPMATGTKSVSEFIDDAINSVNGSAGKGSPTYWKQIKDQVDRIYNLNKDIPLSNLDKVKLKWLGSQVQEGLNAAVPGRAAPAAALARSQTIPNAISGAFRSMPWWAKVGATAGATSLGGEGLMKILGSVGTHR